MDRSEADIVASLPGQASPANNRTVLDIFFRLSSASGVQAKAEPLKSNSRALEDKYLAFSPIV